MSTQAALILGAVLLLGNAFFVGAEFALVSARRTQIEPRAQQGSALAAQALRAMEQVSLVMAAAQFGITVCSLGLGAVAEPALAHLLEPVAERCVAGLEDHVDPLHALEVVLGVIEQQRVERLAGEEQRLRIRLGALLLEHLRLLLLDVTKRDEQQAIGTEPDRR